MAKDTMEIPTPATILRDLAELEAKAEMLRGGAAGLDRGQVVIVEAVATLARAQLVQAHELTRLRAVFEEGHLYVRTEANA